jgi:CubicO group peptidase (beta-lactamase class C family)
MVVVLAAAVLCVPAAAADRSAAIERALARAHFSGSVLVADSRGVVLDTARGRGLTTRTLYDVGSVAKLFTAAAVVALEQRGALDLDVPIARYLPHVPARDAGITIRRLLTHTSGLPGDFAGDLEALTARQAVTRILALHPAAPGRFVYSNAGYVLLAAIVQRVARTPFQTYVRERLLRRARLTATGWYGDPQLRRAPRADGYVGGVDRGTAGARPLSWSIVGAGGMLSTTHDLYRWARALDAGRILDRTHTRELLRGEVALPGQPGVEAGFGGVVAATPHGSVVATGGGTDFGFTADLRRYRPQGVVTVVLSNSDRAPADRVGFALEHALFG